MASHLDWVREAIITSEKISGCEATLWATTVATPPAPIIMTLLMVLCFMRILALGREPRC